MINLRDIAYVRSGTADLEAAVRFAVDIVGLQEQERDDGAAYLRADHRHHCLAFVEGESGVLASAFSLGDENELADAERQLEAAGVPVARGTSQQARARRVRDLLAFDDPFGNRFELVVDQARDARPVAFGRSAGITEFGHLCVDAPDVREAYRFWSGLFNVRISDWIGDWAALLRIDQVHHKLAVFRGGSPGLCHINFQVTSLDDVMRSWHFLEENGVEIQQGPGRHPQSTAVFLYFKGPEGLTYEYSYGVQLIEDEASWQPRWFDPMHPASIDMWCGTSKRVSTQPQVRRPLGADR
ncbi:VOC family protein [Kribbella kalugense]|uniref:2,3-dihydroxy-p-cumate/2,3-dihydroxybenzoate 3,4-dioxygenase n=1 Tax=Kribbella kalugense TaxID=2512221 RepID=A0A4R8A1X2_9ACTN|nr:VOC family protein [Kribbella kalugense]TDW24206.1 2,3-dihydroxy-p-cumate/2,3-dihydroxybenzoate 3,4-dioxygenase [Kribbella kalugense]